MKFLLLTAGTGKMNGYMNNTPNSHVGDILSRHSNGHLSFAPTLNFIRALSSAARILDRISLLFILVGFGIVLSSFLGNNGKWRKSGYGMIVGGYSWILVVHILIVAGPAFGNLGKQKVLIFLMMLLGQVLFYVASSTLFTIGSQNMETFEMSSQPTLERSAQQEYNFMMITMAVGAVVYFIAGLI